MRENPAMRVALIGATGSVGMSVVQVCEAFPERFTVHSMAARHNAEGLVMLQKRTGCRVLALAGEADPGKYGKIATAGTKWICGEAALGDLAEDPEADVVVVASSGVAAVSPVLKALQAGKRVCLANKESLIAAGKWILEALQYENQLLPLDSEHNAVWQCLGKKCSCDGVERIILTASGGPFLELPLESLEHVGVEDVLQHPVWSMGAKITVDSSTMMNKGFEIMEAAWLFGCAPEQVSAVIHPESRVHGMVDFVDGTRRMAAYSPDMRIPILSALAYPDVLPCPGKFRKVGAADSRQLTFREIDPGRFPCFPIALDVFRKGGGYPAFLVGADEEAVRLFLDGRVRYRDIPAVIEKAVGSFAGHVPGDWREAVLLVEEGATRVREQAEKH